MAGLEKGELSVSLVFSMTGKKKPAQGGSLVNVMVSQEGFSDLLTATCEVAEPGPKYR